MSAVVIRPVGPEDAGAVGALVRDALGVAEARLVCALRADGDVVLELAAERNGAVRGHILFSRLWVEAGAERVPALALAPLAVEVLHRGEGIARGLIEESHARLTTAGETLAVVLGNTAFYGRFGYTHALAASFASDYQGEHLQALAWEPGAPRAGRLVYAPAFAAL